MSFTFMLFPTIGLGLDASYRSYLGFRNNIVVTLTASYHFPRGKDSSVKAEEKGVTLTLENIQFPLDSALLLDSEKQKLMGISEILKRYADRDILITGHTARVGTEESSQALSEQRAKAVGDYLISLGAVRETQIITRGMGSREPLADNATEAGRRLNRRVEITILEN